jgi:Tfp pilus assembly protein PilP
MKCLSFLLFIFGTQAFAQVPAPKSPGVPPAGALTIQPLKVNAPVHNLNASAPQAVGTKISAPVQVQPTPIPVVTTTPQSSAVDALLSEDLIRSLRDPFQIPSILLMKKDAPKSDLEMFSLKDFKLNGVVTGPKKTRAMVTTPGNKVFFVKVGDRMGNRDGTVTKILPDSIRVTEYYVDEHGKRQADVYELTMSGDLTSLNKKEE